MESRAVVMFITRDLGGSHFVVLTTKLTTKLTTCLTTDLTTKPEGASTVFSIVTI